MSPTLLSAGRLLHAFGGASGITSLHYEGLYCVVWSISRQMKEAFDAAIGSHEVP